MTEASSFATEHFLTAIGKFTGRKTNKEGLNYFVETATGNHVPCRISIPTAVPDKNGKVIRKFLGTFGAFATALAWAQENCTAQEYQEVKKAICQYYNQPETIKPGPSIEALKLDPSLANVYAEDAQVPGVVLADAYEPSKRKRKSSKEKGPAPPPKPVKKKVKPAVVNVLTVPKGFYRIRTTKKANNAPEMLLMSSQVMSLNQRFGEGCTTVHVSDEVAVTYDTNAGMHNPWCVFNSTCITGLKGDLLVRTTKSLTIAQETE